MAASELRVRLTPRADRTALTDWREGVLHVRVFAPPVDGAANKALVELLASALGLRKSAIIIRSGQSSRDKKLAVEGLDPDELEAVLLRALDRDTA